MLAWFTACALLFAAAGFGGGLYIACRFAWPRGVYDLLFAARP